jgi:caffeoyl-CoA O-methyltransferase
MNGITDKDVERYMYELLPPRDEVLAEIEAEATRRDIPIIGPAVGRVLAQYAQILGARRVFEMGSAIGYSTIWLARAVGAGGRVYYTDSSERNATEARGYFRRAGLDDRIQVLIGNSIDLIETVDGDLDLVFNDVDKHQYPDAFRKAVPRLRRGGLFITDNALCYGRVARADSDRDTEGVREFNRLIYYTSELYTTILPIRDGVAVCRKL